MPGAGEVSEAGEEGNLSNKKGPIFRGLCASTEFTP